MQLNLDPNTSDYMISAVKPSEIVVNDTAYTKSLIVGAKQLIENWPVSHFKELTTEHLSIVFELQPKLLIIGTGNEHHFLPAEIQAMFLAQGIGIEAMSTAAACRTFNVCMSEGREAVAALIIEAA